VGTVWRIILANAECDNTLSISGYPSKKSGKMRATSDKPLNGIGKPNGGAKKFKICTVGTILKSVHSYHSKVS
jgi:hypothetical protein